jgi:hypothetical protein
LNLRVDADGVAAPLSLKLIEEVLFHAGAEADWPDRPADD